MPVATQLRTVSLFHELWSDGSAATKAQGRFWFDRPQASWQAFKGDLASFAVQSSSEATPLAMSPQAEPAAAHPAPEPEIDAATPAETSEPAEAAATAATAGPAQQDDAAGHASSVRSRSSSSSEYDELASVLFAAARLPGAAASTEVFSDRSVGSASPMFSRPASPSALGWTASLYAASAGWPEQATLWSLRSRLDAYASARGNSDYWAPQYPFLFRSRLWRTDAEIAANPQLQSALSVPPPPRLASPRRDGLSGLFEGIADAGAPAPETVIEAAAPVLQAPSADAADEAADVAVAELADLAGDPAASPGSSSAASPTSASAAADAANSAADTDADAAADADADADADSVDAEFVSAYPAIPVGDAAPWAGARPPATLPIASVRGHLYDLRRSSSPLPRNLNFARREYTRATRPVGYEVFGDHYEAVRTGAAESAPEAPDPARPVLSRELLIERLVEGKREDYRRLFLPGRGWIARLKVQTELGISDEELAELVAESVRVAAARREHRRSQAVLHAEFERTAGELEALVTGLAPPTVPDAAARNAILDAARAAAPEPKTSESARTFSF